MDGPSSNGRRGGSSSSSSCSGTKDTNGISRSGAEGKKRRTQSDSDVASAPDRDVAVSSRPATASASSMSEERRADQSDGPTSNHNRSRLSSPSLSSSPSMPKKKRKRKISNASDQDSPKPTTQKQQKKTKKRRLEADTSTGGSPPPVASASASASASSSRAQAAARKGNKSLSAVEMALARLEARSASVGADDANNNSKAAEANVGGEEKSKSKADPKSKSKSPPSAEKRHENYTNDPNGGAPAKKIKKRKKKKRHSPFRVRVGCVVALRYQSGDDGKTNARIKQIGTSNGDVDESSTPQVVEVWADPQPGRDDGWALIGRRIRCVFPKSMPMCGTSGGTASSPESSSRSTGSRSTSPVPRTNRALEGEVVAIVDRKRDGANGTGGSTSSITTVSLLIDESVAKEYDFLPTDSIASGIANDSGAMSSIELKRMEMERKIRGEGKVAVLVALADAGSGASGSNFGARWSIRKRLPVPAAIAAELSGDAPNSQSNEIFVGDGNDTAAQQQQNWRWLASSPAFSTSMSAASGIFAGNAIGEVIKVEPSAAAVAAGTLATVTVRRMWLPEHTLSGRLAHHGPMELFDDDDDDDDDDSKGRNTDGAVLLEVPIEHIVIVGRHADRTPTAGYGDSGCGEDSITQHFYVVRRYCATNDCFTNAGGIRTSSSAFCHRCKMSFDSTLMKQCSSDACRYKSPWWCKGCIRQVQSASSAADSDAFESANAADVQGWIGPCCTGRCDCTTCLQPSGGMVIGEELSNAFCSICAKPCADKVVSCVSCKKCSRASDLECAAWERALRHTTEEGSRPSDILHSVEQYNGDVAAQIKCRSCRDKKKQKKAEKMKQNDGSSGDREDPFKNLSRLMASTNPFDFNIPASFGTMIEDKISFEPFTKAAKRKPSKATPITFSAEDGAETMASAGAGKKRAKSPANKRKRASVSPLPSPKASLVDEAAKVVKLKDSEDTLEFKPTCSRTLQYDPTKKDLNALHSFDPLDDINGRVHISRRRTEAEDTGTRGLSAKVAETKKANSRAARASQRRMLRDVASFGASGIGVDTLAGRDKEQSIRFGRSGIHAWGVFADEKISKGDMIVEYRGVLISNRVAEKREKEYEKIKVGSDYMFRIDSEVVCDATYQGNVARFINASCEPNCFTKIVTIDGTKRIVIFAKRDIKPGEELVYDYMFPLEYDEKKRIPCHCGSAKCKGFMNWDNRYVVIPPKEKSEGDTKKPSTPES